MPDLIGILLKLPAVFLAMSFHEYAHALAAFKLGDPTPRNMGRLTLDPLVHVDWIGLVLFAVFGFGWAKPVRVNPSNFKNKKWGDIMVSLAGPAANLFLAAIGALAYTVLILYELKISTRVYEVLEPIVDNIVWYNVVFFFLNLLPIPPLDGYKVIKGLFFRKNIRLFLLYEQYGSYVLIILILFNILDLILNGPIWFVYGNLILVSSQVIGLFT